MSAVYAWCGETAIRLNLLERMSIPSRRDNKVMERKIENNSILLSSSSGKGSQRKPNEKRENDLVPRKGSFPWEKRDERDES
jgi:hypothetical protein